MLAQCIEWCPDDLWTEPSPPSSLPPELADTGWADIERPFWRIAFHDIFFTHLYLGQDRAAFRGPSAEIAVGRREDFERLWSDPAYLEPYELPKGTVPCERREILEYLGYVDGLVDATVDGLDLDTSDSGFPWYKDITKLSHQLMNLRHLQGHVGQLSELLMRRGIDTRWTSKAAGLGTCGK
jgi:hypothetical protein